MLKPPVSQCHTATPDPCSVKAFYVESLGMKRSKAPAINAPLHLQELGHAVRFLLYCPSGSQTAALTVNTAFAFSAMGG